VQLCTVLYCVLYCAVQSVLCIVLYCTVLCTVVYCTVLYCSSGNFCIPRTNLCLSDKAFAVAGPRAWNSLPTSVRLTATKSTFCKHLKTHLFRVSYGHLS